MRLAPPHSVIARISNALSRVGRFAAGRFIVAVLLLQWVACDSKGPATPSPPSPLPPATFTLSGGVSDAATSAPIGGATLSIVDSVNAGKSATTNATGNFVLTGLQQANFTIAVSASKYVSSGRSVALTSNQSIAFQLTLMTFTVSGTVRDGVSGAPVGNVAVQIGDGANAGQSARTGVNGRYEIGSVKPEPLTMSASAATYQTTTQSITVVADTSADFTLQRSCSARPGTPEFLGWTSAGLPPGSVQLMWQEKNEPILSYIVEVGTTVGGTDVAVIDTNSTATSYMLSGLRTSVNLYHARIRAKNACGISAPSNEANPRIL